MDDANESIKNKKGLISATLNEINDWPIKSVRKQKLSKTQKCVKSPNTSTSNSDIDVSTYSDSDIVASDISDIYCTYETEIGEYILRFYYEIGEFETDYKTGVLTEGKLLGNKTNEKEEDHKNIDEGDGTLKAEAEGKEKLGNKTNNSRKKTEEKSLNKTEGK